MRKLYKSPNEVGAFVLRLENEECYHITNSSLSKLKLEPSDFDFMLRVNFDIEVQGVLENAMHNIDRLVTEPTLYEEIIEQVNQSIQNFE